MTSLLLIDAPGGPQPGDLVRSLRPFGQVRTVTVAWGSARTQAARLEHLRTLGPAEVVERPDQVIDAGLRWAEDTGGVVALSEIVSFYAGVLANLIGVPSNPPAALHAARHKDVQRARLDRRGVPSPRARLLTDGDAPAAADGLRFPVILKPATGVGSLCVYRAGDAAKLTAAYEEALRRYHADPRPNGARPIFLIEEEIAGVRWHRDSRFGHQVSVESLVHESTVHHLGITDKLPLVAPFRESGHVSPSTLDTVSSERVRRVAEEAIHALGITTGAVHTELMLTAEGPVVIEVNARLGGGVYELLKFTRGYDIVAAIASIALGKPPELPSEPSGYAAFVKPQPAEGRFRVHGVDAQAATAALAAAEWGVLDKEPGALLDSASGTNANLARFLAHADSAEELFAKIESIDRGLRRAITLEPVR